MIFAAPWILLGLGVLPLLWWLLRVTPPAARSETFPAIRLLLGLRATEETPSRTPWWLLALRLAAAALIVVALARPVLDAGSLLPGTGPVLLVVDDGWSAAPGWGRRMQAAQAALDRAERAGRPVALLATAPSEAGEAPHITATMPVTELRPVLAALHPHAWPPDRDGAARALRGWDHPGSAMVYVADGVAQGGSFADFAQALAAAGTVTELCCTALPARLLLPPRAEADRLVARLVQTPQPAALGSPDAATLGVLAQSGDGRTLARALLTLPPGATTAEAPILLPPELRNKLGRLVLEGPASAGAVVLLDEGWRRRPVGLLPGDPAKADTPLAGELFYVRRALAPFAELREGDARTLLARDLSVLVIADRSLPAGEERDAIGAWVDKGGLLLRFAGPNTAEHPDTLLPVSLLAGDRQLGGALSWSQPAGLAPFDPASPFAGLTAPEEVKVTRQVLAEPSASLSAHSWARLADGTPLVTEAAHGAGRIVLFHVTANADWSSLPLSGVFVDMLRRVVQLSAGVARDEPGTVLAPAEALDGYGTLSPPPSAATGLAAGAFATTAASPRHPPGLYGPENGRQALNLANAMPAPTLAPLVDGARIEALDGVTPERALGPWLLAAALLLLAVDLLASLRLRGLLRPAMIGGAAVLALLLVQAAPAAAQAARPGDPPQASQAALQTRLAYLVTGDDQVDGIARAGLLGLSDYVNRRTAASLAEPDAVVPGRDDLSVYPLLYWPVVAEAPALSADAVRALNVYMGNGGIIVVDTRNGGSGEGFNPGTDETLQRVAAALSIPALAPLTSEHVLARAFYLLQNFPGRYDGATVWVQRDQDRANDSVSPVIIGGHDWAAAWAVDDAGHFPYAAIPGGDRQRTLAYHFGVNLVMYALTGNYKGDQVHVPAILERLGQ